jgi:thiol-disulfide isomerase/thioredoxin
MKQTFTLIIVLLIGFSLHAQVEKKTVVEHFTNTLCGICASKNPALHELLDDYPEVIRLTVHPSSPYSTCIFSQHNPEENDERTNFYGIYGGTPRVVVAGDVIPIQTPLLTVGQLEGAIGLMSDFSISIEHTAGNGDEVNVSITVERVSGTDNGENMLYVALAEKEIDYNAPNGETMHYGVFRKKLFDQTVSLFNPGESTMINETYVPDDEWEAGKIVVIAILQADDKTVLQSEESDFVSGGSAGIGKPAFTSEDNLFHPNPSSDYIQLLEVEEERFVKAEVYDLLGSRMVESSLNGPIDIRSFPEGLYFVILTDRNYRQYSTKVLKLGR